MQTMRLHEKLNVWQKAIELCVLVYKATAQLPDSEKYGLCSQMRRAVVSVGSNIAEGAARGSTNQYIQSLHVARGSLAELDTQSEICRRLQYFDQATYDRIMEATEVVGRMLTNLIKALKAK
ncbi:MAG: four helix bundle protein [Candidatus Aureabacteria bacterium]|nr:four helix bundle protein [Candidatus Auribacterota bacterium]